MAMPLSYQLSAPGCTVLARLRLSITLSLRSRLRLSCTRFALDFMCCFTVLSAYSFTVGFAVGFYVHGLDLLFSYMFAYIFGVGVDGTVNGSAN